MAEMQRGKGSPPDSEVSSVGAGGIGAFINLGLLPFCGSLVGAELSAPSFSLCIPPVCVWRGALTSGLLETNSSIHPRITKRFGLEGTFKDHLVSSFSAVTSLPQQHMFCQEASPTL